MQFFDTSGVGPTSWQWNFGDGVTSSAQNPSYAYSTYGTFDVSLSVANAAGAASTTQSVSVSLPVEACGTWRQVATGSRLDSVVYGGGRFVAVGPNGAVASSVDGEVWTYHPRVEGGPYLREVIWTGSRYVAVGSEGVMMASEDGVSWSAVSSPDPGGNYNLESVAWSGSQYAVTGKYRTGSSGALWTSPDGETWTLRDSSSSIYPRSVQWDGRQFIWIGEAGRVATSPDGAVWEVQYLGSSLTMLNLVWNGSQYLLTNAAVVWTSSDAQTWELHEGLSGVPTVDIAWVGNRYVGVEGNRISTSPDGLSWTVENQARGSVLGVGWDGRQAVVVGTAGSGGASARSRRWAFSSSPSAPWWGSRCSFSIRPG